MTAAEFVQGLEAVRQHGDGYMARCPAHDDRTPSLSVKDGDEGGVVVYCFARCTPEAVCAAHGYELPDLAPPNPDGNGNGRRRIVTSYRYEDAQGHHVFDVVRFDPKDFGNAGQRQRPMDLEPEGDQPRPLPPAAGARSGPGGRGDLDRRRREGRRRSHQGWTRRGHPTPKAPASGAPEYSESLRGVNVVIVADRDEPGRTTPTVSPLSSRASPTASTSSNRQSARTPPTTSSRGKRCGNW